MDAIKMPQAAQTNMDEALRQICPYSIYKQKWPTHLSGNLGLYFSLLRDALHQHHPASITTVVATHYRPYEKDPAVPYSVRLYTFGRFRKSYSAMTQMAVALADLYREIPILPLISPVFAKDWETQVSSDGTLYQIISRYGLLCYSVLEGDLDTKEQG